MALEKLDVYFSEFYEDSSKREKIPGQGYVFLDIEDHEDCFGIIVISNSCDIDNHVHDRNNKYLEYVSYLPIYEAATYFPFPVSNTRIDSLVKIIKEEHKTYFYLPPDKRTSSPNEKKIRGLGALINCQNLRSMPIKQFISMYTEPHVILKSPYREKLNLAVCNLFSRIPLDQPADHLIKEWIKSQAL